MKDAQGAELKVGDRVAFTVGTGILFGSIVKLRVSRRYNWEYEIAKVLLEIPETRIGQIRYLRDKDTGAYLRDENGVLRYEQNPNKVVTTRDVEGSARIALCPKPTKTTE